MGDHDLTHVFPWYNRNGHYTRALEEAIQTHAGQWPTAWQARNPLHGGGSFNKMTPEERVCTLALKSLCKQC